MQCRFSSFFNVRSFKFFVYILYKNNFPRTICWSSFNLLWFHIISYIAIENATQKRVNSAFASMDHQKFENDEQFPLKGEVNESFTFYQSFISISLWNLMDQLTNWKYNFISKFNCEWQTNFELDVINKFHSMKYHHMTIFAFSEWKLKILNQSRTFLQLKCWYKWYKTFN